MVRVNWTVPARLDLDEIKEYISKTSEKYAKLELEKIVKATAELGKFPNLGKMVSGKHRPPIRQIISGQYKILYQHDNDHDELWIIRVIHGSLDTNLDHLVFEPETEYENVFADELTPEEHEALRIGLESVKNEQKFMQEEIEKLINEWFKHLPGEE